MAKRFQEALIAILGLAEIEWTLKRLALEIERTKRRVSALETIVLPRLEATARFVRLALEDREREESIRLKIIRNRMQEEKSA
ncbi:hypothetical protein EU537_01375 [Candidatus Thorarchaeota archaeon]|nr:MAG: hypothetical protein EU537_01375 [Candidatus Thorarchaeota archaeon]